MRRMFYRWLAAARKSRHRRLLLQEKEEQFKVRAKARAWDKWRGRYLDIKLQPMVRSGSHLTLHNDLICSRRMRS